MTIFSHDGNDAFQNLSFNPSLGSEFMFHDIFWLVGVPPFLTEIYLNFCQGGARQRLLSCCACKGGSFESPSSFNVSAAFERQRVSERDVIFAIGETSGAGSAGKRRGRVRLPAP
ncbi:hypothetical protein SISSUDRAFT_581017 [Sistotremastrum suecicum HHB10207 ss-3]|uniref:Uncharacterized protein n=1 Tax=Sistotremastrum suecicum HHB10207 ss-3 TaxID=1314776 RepID=A0A166EPI3_9AGAM|nr:hypothetical protein SISSUDRAFT_581017 [Sistotremastrum suecicum HHB10207 ss-3]